jgi:hypothetical protein
VLVGHETFAAIRRPLHRAPDALRRPQDEHVLGIHAAAHAEAAADLAGHDAQVALRRLQNLLGDRTAQAIRALDAGVERVAAGAPVELADGAARLHRRRRHAVDDEVDLRDMGRTGERALDRVAVARLPHEGHVVGRVVPHGRRAGACRVRGGRHHGQRLVLDRQHLGGVHGLLRRLRDHHRHRIADVTDAIARQRRARRLDRGRAVAPLARGVARQVAELVRRVVRAGEDRDHAGRLRRARGIDRPDARVRVRRPHDERIRLAREVHVIGVAPEALDEARVFDTAHGLPDCELLDDDGLTHGSGVYVAPRAAR